VKNLLILALVVTFAFFSCGKKESSKLENEIKTDTFVKKDTVVKKDIKVTDKVAPEVFIKAVKEGNIGGVKNMLTKDPALVNVKSTDGLDESPLNMAAFKGYKEICEMLIKAGADVNFRDFYGNTPLHNAVRMNHKVIAELLINNKADINTKNYTQDNLIFYAAYFEHPDMVKYLISKGVDKNVPNISGKTPMQVAIEKKRDKIIKVLK